ncbi:MAG: ATP-binding cassette domain-containing protein [Verrucomicrobiales bacterium]|nr:ATP-binding cassette domain-containing protein [Verrucomicrobiales bacterium]
MSDQPSRIDLRGVELAYGSYVVMRDINASIRRGEVFVIMGGSGCGKSTLLRAMIGLMPPAQGEIRYDGELLFSADRTPDDLARRFGVLFQGGALWSSMTLAENIALPLEQYTRLKPAEIRQVVRHKLALVGLKGFEDYRPAEISGGMKKRAGLARAMALDPEILFFDEPSAGLDPLSSRRLDELILQLRDVLGTTVVVVTHELESIFAIADTALFLNAQTRTPTALGNPHELLKHSTEPAVRAFLTRGESSHETPAP